MTAGGIHRTIDALWRIESPKLIAGLARRVRDVGVAEELAQDALVAALECGPVVAPERPLMRLLVERAHVGLVQACVGHRLLEKLAGPLPQPAV